MTPQTPWHRQPWPWILMAGPALAIAAGAVTTVIAFSGADGVVADDYYKRGLAINRTLAREARAQSLGVDAQVRLEGGWARARIDARARLPDRIRLTLAHPTRAGLDRVVMLARNAAGEYEARLDGGGLAAGRWLVVLETPEWRWAASTQAGS